MPLARLPAQFSAAQPRGESDGLAEWQGLWQPAPHLPPQPCLLKQLLPQATAAQARGAHAALQAESRLLARLSALPGVPRVLMQDEQLGVLVQSHTNATPLTDWSAGSAGEVDKALHCGLALARLCEGLEETGVVHGRISCGRLFCSGAGPAAPGRLPPRQPGARAAARAAHAAGFCRPSWRSWPPNRPGASAPRWTTGPTFTVWAWCSSRCWRVTRPGRPRGHWRCCTPC